MNTTMITCLLASAAALLAPCAAAQQRDPPAKQEAPPAGKAEGKPDGKGAATQDPTPDPRTELKQRMKDRYAALEGLRDAGKIGETFLGFAEVVNASHGQDKVDPKDQKSLTIAELVGAENKDRQRLYELLGKDLKLTAEEVGKQNGIRILQKADDDHWFKLADGRWVQRKSVQKQEKEEKGPKGEETPPPRR